jgi:hypothetical protein
LSDANQLIVPHNVQRSSKCLRRMTFCYVVTRFTCGRYAGARLEALKNRDIRHTEYEYSSPSSISVLQIENRHPAACGAMPPSKRPSSLGKYQYNSRQPQPQPPKQQQYQQHAQQQQQQQQYQQPQYQQQQRQQYQQQQQQYQHQLQQQREEQWKSGSNHSEESSASSSSRGSNNSSNSPSNTSRASRPSGSGARESMAQKKRTVLSEQRRSSGASQQSRAASYNDSRQIRSPPCIFDIFFDLPHPGASKDSERARMIEPPNDSVQSIVAELYEASAISRLARFAFPEHDDHQHGRYLIRP